MCFLKRSSCDLDGDALNDKREILYICEISYAQLKVKNVHLFPFFTAYKHRKILLSLI